MANPADITRLGSTMKDAEVDAIRQQVNNLTASLRLLTAKLDLDAGVTDTNFKALITDAGVATAPVTINRVLG